MKTSGFNLKNLDKDDEDMESVLDIENEHDIKRELRMKKRKKLNFDKLFPMPKHNENMGMDNIFNGEPFDGIL